MDRTLEPDQIYRDLESKHWESCCRYARKLTEGSALDAEEIVVEAFEEIYYALYAADIEYPERWLKKAIKRRFLNSIRGKLKQASISLEWLQEGDDTTTEKLPTYVLKAPDEDEPSYALEARETEADQRAFKKKVILATHLNARVKQFATHHLVEGWSYESIAHEYGTTVAQVQSAVRRCVNVMAKKQLLQMVELEGGTK